MDDPAQHKERTLRAMAESGGLSFLAQMVWELIREHDTLARITADEFANGREVGKVEGLRITMRMLKELEKQYGESAPNI